MSKENVILIDYDAPNDWEFHKAIEKATGNKWRVYKAVSNENHGGVLQKFISDEMGMEFATASLHNSFYFVEAKNIIHDRPMVAKNFENLVNELLRSNSPKKWFRAYFNHGLINYIYGQKRLLPCDMSFDTFFIDPYGDVMPCNGTKDKEVMGNLNNQTWDELWNSPEAEKVRAKVRCCDRDCWMIGSVSPAMHKYIWKPATWVLVHKFKALFTKHPYSMYTENCYSCQYATIERVADVTIGDSWGSDLPQKEQGRGVSLLLCQTDKGANLVKNSGMQLKEVDIDKAIDANHQLRHPSVAPDIREAFFAGLDKGFYKSLSNCAPKVYYKQKVKEILIKTKIIRGGKSNRV